jgi:hypothetical protein
MRKFAFRDSTERQALISSVERHMPKLAAKFAAFSDQFPMDTQQNPQVEQHAEALRGLLDDFLSQLGLDKNHEAIMKVERIIQDLKPVLQHAQEESAQDNFADKLADVPWTTKAPPETENPNSESVSLEAPPVQKISPTDQKLSPHRASSEAVQKTAEYDALLNGMVELADLADEAGMTVAADRLAAVFPMVHTLKTAQYEGFNNYWIANGRAFEMAYKQKRMKGGHDPEKFRSPNEVWWEVLEEFQKSLLSNQQDFISKYAQKTPQGTDRTASVILANSISDRMQEGSDPGVAFYEAIDDLADGKHAAAVEINVRRSLQFVAEEAKQAGNTVVAEKADALLKTAGWGDAWKAVKKKLGLLSEPQDLYEQIQQGLTKSDDNYRTLAVTGQDIPYAQMYHAVDPLVRPLMTYRRLWSKVGPALSSLPDITTFVDKEDEEMSPAQAKTYWDKLKTAADKIVRYPPQTLKKLLEDKVVPWAGAPVRKPAVPATPTAPTGAPANPAVQPTTIPDAAALEKASKEKDPVAAVLGVLDPLKEFLQKLDELRKPGTPIGAAIDKLIAPTPVAKPPITPVPATPPGAPTTPIVPVPTP